MMIRLTRLNGKAFVLNAELVEILEATPDTVVTLSNGNRFVVSESVDEVIERIVEYRRQVYHFTVELNTDKSGV